jgi:hypothetical protein
MCNNCHVVFIGFFEHSIVIVTSLEVVVLKFKFLKKTPFRIVSVQYR